MYMHVSLKSTNSPGSQLLSVNTVEHLIKSSYAANNESDIFSVIISLKCFAHHFQDLPRNLKMKTICFRKNGIQI
jgi:hypothetical protein